MSIDLWCLDCRIDYWFAVVGITLEHHQSLRVEWSVRKITKEKESTKQVESNWNIQVLDLHYLSDIFCCCPWCSALPLPTLTPIWPSCQFHASIRGSRDEFTHDISRSAPVNLLFSSTYTTYARSRSFISFPRLHQHPLHTITTFIMTHQPLNVERIRKMTKSEYSIIRKYIQITNHSTDDAMKALDRCK